MQNSLLLNEQRLQSVDFILKTKARSLAFGRRLYQFKASPVLETHKLSLFWLKAQQTIGEGSKQATLGFQHELNMYEVLNAQNASFLLPFQICKTEHLKMNLGTCNPYGLILPNAVPILEQNADQLTIEQIKVCFINMVNVLHELTQLGWLHADVKKEHFVDYAGQMRLIDFEQSLALGAKPFTAMNATPRYMAPELFQGQAKSIQSDIYSLGIVMLEWLSATRLCAQNYEDWAYLHCQRLNIDLPQHFLCFKSLLQSMLAKQKSQRICDFSQIKTRLMTEIV